MHRSLLRLPAILVACITLALGCGETFTEVPLAVTSLVIEGEQSTLRMNGTMPLVAIPKSASGKVLTARSVTWSPSNAQIATVSPSGVVTGVAPGRVVITAREDVSGASDQVTIDVNWTLVVDGAGNGNGTVTGTGTCTITGGSGRCEYPLTNATVTLTAAAAAAGHTFGGWGGYCSGTSPNCAIPASATRQVTATFRAPFVLTVQRGGSGAGTVMSSPSGINCTITTTGTSGTCSAPFADGTPVSLSQTANTGNVFTSWTGDCTGSGACQLQMNANRTVTATFTAGYLLSIQGTGVGSGRVTGSAGGIDCTLTGSARAGTCDGTFQPNVQLTLTAVPSGGQTLEGWGGACSGMNSTCQLTMSSARNVTVSFRDVCAPASHAIETTVAGNLTSSSCSPPVQGVVSSDYYSYTLTDQSLLRFTVTSSVIAPVMAPLMRQDSNTTYWLRAGPSPHAQVVLAPAGTYHVWVGTTGALGAYSLASTRVAGSAVTGCGDVYTTTGVANASLALTAGCSYVPRNLPGQFYGLRFYMYMAPGPLNVRVSSTTFDPLIEIFDANGAFLGSSASQTGRNANLTVNNVPVSAYVWVTSRVPNTTGSFTISTGP